jgi:uncharacterized protein YchJ
MSNGRNTSVIGIRLDDSIVIRLKKLAKNRTQGNMSDLLRPIIADFASRETIKYQKRNIIEAPPDLEKNPDYWDSPEPIKAINPGRNKPCPCGAKHPDGNPIKFKHCCGSPAKH